MKNANMLNAALKQMIAKSVVVDTYTPLHVYTLILPTACLQLPD